MKKFLKNIAMNSVEKAFTSMNHYQPKMPKALLSKIRSK